MSAAGKITALYRLLNGDERARAHPESFDMPSYEARQRLRVGDLVKLIFEPVDAPGGERMWVRVTECLATIPRRYVGVLHSHAVTVPLTWGSRVDFGAEHVVDIDDRVPGDGRVA